MNMVYFYIYGSDGKVSAYNVGDLGSIPGPGSSPGEGKGGMIWENGILTCILSCKKRIASLCSMQDTGCLGLVHRDDPER